MDEDLFENIDKILELSREEVLSIMNQRYDDFYRAVVRMEVSYLTKAISDPSFKSTDFAKAYKIYVDEFPSIPFRITMAEYDKSVSKLARDQEKIASLNIMLHEVLMNS